MHLSDIRQKFLDYFASHHHEIIKSSSLIPDADPTLLFTNAGMNQFKDVFLGLEKRNYVRATSAQKCVRAGGKHNDLENVGYTARHHTFFEMLGNFSFGDYFKRDAICYAWEFLTKILQISKNKLYVTVYYTDDEAYNIWHEVIGLSTEKIIRIGDKPTGGSDNFWQMGETGPCGPCTEIFYDHGDKIEGGVPGSSNEDGDRYIEIWNCVFMQFNRDETGKLNPLPRPSVDTGMGLERISAVMQGVHSNYEIDLFVALINQAAKITQCDELSNPSLKVLADHIRSIAFLIADGVNPSNEGRGYVLRRVIRRAIRHGYKLGMRKTFLHLLVNELVKQMGSAYPELSLKQQNIEQTILQEEEKFLSTIDNGMSLLQNELSIVKDKQLSGDIAFKLYDTFGFPLDLTQDICRENNIVVDIAGFNVAMSRQKDTAKKAGKFKMDAIFDYTGDDTQFLGYDQVSINAKVVALYNGSTPVNELVAGGIGVIVLDKTVFYAQSGGQVGDIGVIKANGIAGCLFNVDDTSKIRKEVIGHFGNMVNGSIKIGDEVEATYDMHKRLAIKRNHSVTHLLHKALHEVIGKHATQKGSLVSSDLTRFDFAHDKPLTQNEIEKVEKIVNHVIMMNYAVVTQNMNYDEAVKNGVMALFGEKYGDMVRVIQMGDFSVELCGGTHVDRTGDIGFFTITSESGIASGVRRIEAITGNAALVRMQKNMAILDGLREALKAQTNDIIPEKINILQQNNRQLIKDLNELKAKLATYQADALLNNVIQLSNGINSLVLELHDLDSKELLELMDKLKNKLVSGIIVLGCKNAEQANFVVGVTKDLAAKYKAGAIVSYLSGICGGKGGGRPDLAQGGGVDVKKLSQALLATNKFIEEME
ncbi:MAG: alanine--tRNA ligase [Proteobacteria bacterium]|jgi:alanyl-tRNA synthetase|nr:alanine--tRNA ligase [Pseudomonadota bacterium]